MRTRWYWYNLKIFISTNNTIMWNLLIIPVALRPIVKYPIVDNLEDDGDSTFIKCAFWRRSPPEVFLGQGVLKICSKFYRKEHPYRSTISIKLLCNFIEIALWHGRSPSNLLQLWMAAFGKLSNSNLKKAEVGNFGNFLGTGKTDFINSYHKVRHFHRC